MKLCHMCGAKLADDALFCLECGAEQKVIQKQKELKDEDALVVAVEQAKNGDTAGFEYLFNRFYKDKLFVVNCILHNEQDAEDVMQEAYMKMMSHIAQLANPVAFPAWFGRICVNTAIDLYRKKNKSTNKVVSFSDLQMENDEGEDVTLQFEDESMDHQPEFQCTDAERKEILNEMLGCLTEDQRSCIVLRFVEGLSEKEVAEMLGWPVGTVKTRVHAAKKALAKQAEQLQKKGYQFYSIAPLPLLLWLLRQEAAAAGAQTVAASMAAASVTSGTSAVYTTGTAGAVATPTGAGTSAVSTAGTAGAKAMGTLATKIALGIAGLAVVGGIAVAILNYQKEDKENQTTAATEITTEITTEAVETTTEATTEEVVEEVDPNELYQSYINDVLIPSYGVIPAYQEDSATADYNGIQFYEIYDYNQDGVLDLFVKVFSNVGKDGANFVTYAPNFGVYCDVHDLFYTIEDGEVVLKNDTKSENWIRKMGLMDNSYVFVLTEDDYWRVTTNDAVYLLQYHGMADGGGSNLKIYRFTEDHFEWIAVTGTSDGEYAHVFRYGCSPDEYQNYSQSYSDSFDVETYLAGFGIDARLVTASPIYYEELPFEFSQENVLLYQMKNGTQRTSTDNAVYVETKNSLQR